MDSGHYSTSFTYTHDILSVFTTDQRHSPRLFLHGDYSRICTSGKCRPLKGKGRYSSSWEPHLTATGRHLPYLPPDTSEHAPPNASHAGWWY